MTLRRSFTGLLLVLATLGLATAQVASAATLGGLTSRHLGAWRLTGGTGAPVVVAWDDFSRPDNTNLDGRPTAADGPPWDVVAGNWINTGSSARATPANANAAAVVNCQSSNLTVVATLSGPTSFSAGLVVKALGTWLLTVNYRNQSNGTLEVATVANGNRTVLATATNVGRPSPATLAATYENGTVTVQLNGVTRLTHTLAPLYQLVFVFSTHAGLYSAGDAQTRFDDVRCEHP